MHAFLVSVLVLVAIWIIVMGASVVWVLVRWIIELIGSHPHG